MSPWHARLGAWTHQERSAPLGVGRSLDRGPCSARPEGEDAMRLRVLFGSMVVLLAVAIGL
ncbi:MAG TPA: hypothetical protein VGS80_21170, partial [Ktedonobacterales bacterium]|nr:hypothetical protein [Ktedonobacterales bacterium]